MITKRIIEILKNKGITKYKFCKDLGLSNGFLDKPREIATNTYANILEYFPDINPEWLLTGKGEMLNSSHLHPITQSISGNNNQMAGHDINTEKTDRQFFDDKDKLLHEKDERLREKDEYIQELKEIIKELKEIIGELKNK
jgi:hypothetical protein